MNGPTATQVALVRIALGTYVAAHAVTLVPHARELLSRDGVFPERATLFLTGVALTPPLALALVSILAIVATVFACGWWRAPAAVLLWYGWAALFHANPFVDNPSVPYIGFLLLAYALLPPGDALVPRERRRWRCPTGITVGAWAALSLGYLASAWHKLGSPSWRDGTALEVALELPPYGGDHALAHAVSALPGPVLAAATYAALAVEFLPLVTVWSARGRLVLWLATTAMQIAIGLLFELHELTLGMLLVHAFVFDTAWLGDRRWSRAVRMP